MRLLNTETLELHEFLDNGTPRYAILSHTWEREEVLFQDMADITVAERKYGFQKLKGACRLARTQSFDYIWIDTCCIDKSSSAELTEAINSMYRWYKEAAVCYAYLSDVESGMADHLDDHIDPKPGPLALEDFTALAAKMRKSRWYTRGWTLQELIAPPELDFYSKVWIRLGNKKDPRMSALVSDITGVDVHTLLGGDPSEVSIARRMFWASKRKTTRLEDRAYSLLGLFDVNMPLIYGEGKKAFRRLQEEILRTTDDQSIFAWHNSDYSEGTAVDVLAVSPSDFAESGTLSRQAFFRVGREPMTITSQGISCQLPLMSITRLDTSAFRPFTEVDAILDCQLGIVPGTLPTIRLRSLPCKYEEVPNHFYRVMTTDMTKFEGYSIPALLSKTDTVGLDPTQLHRDEYKEILDKSYLQWKLASIVFTRRIPASIETNAPYVGIPWSLSLLSEEHPPDCTSFWLVKFVRRGFAVRITHAYPEDMWETSSMQLQVPPILPRFYGVGHFQIVDGVFDIEVSNRHRQSLIFTTSLIVGRRAMSRRGSPKPWCHIYQSTIPKQTAQTLLGGDYEWRPDNLGWESPKSVVEVGRTKMVLEATAESKEISGVYYHVVAIKMSGRWEEETELVIGNEGHVGEGDDARARGPGNSSPIPLL